MEEVKLTLEDCKAILVEYYKDEEFMILEFSRELVNDDVDSHFRNHHSLKIGVQHNDEVRSLRFYVKPISKDGGNVMSFVDSELAHKKEMLTHTSFISSAKDILDNVNLSFIAKYYTELNGSMLVLEDCSSEDYNPVDDFSLNENHIMVGLQALAKLHAVSIAYEEKRKTTHEISHYKLSDDFGEVLEEVLYRDDKDYVGYKFMQTSLNAICALVDVLPETQIPHEELKSKLNQALEKFYKSSADAKHRKVFSHGDMWAKSVMFKHEGDQPIDCKLANFQYVRYSPPAFDVTEWIVNASGDCTKRMFHDFLQHYYVHLKMQLKSFGIKAESVLPLDEFEVTCKDAATFAKIMKLFYYTVIGVNDEMYRELRQNTEELDKFLYEDRSEYVLNLYNNDEEYKCSIVQLLENLAEDLKNDTLKVEDLYAVIRKDLKTKDFSLVEYKLTPFGCYLDNLKVEVEVLVGGEAKILKYFMKKLPDISNVKEKSLFINSFLKEHGMFRRILPRYKPHSLNMDACLPKCFFSRLQDVIVFEDLTKQSYVALYHRFSLTYEKVLLVIKKMASFHAKTIALEFAERSEHGPEFSLHNAFKEYFVESIYYLPETACNTFTNAAKLGVLSLIDYFHSSGSKLSKEILKEQVLKIYDNIADYLKPSEKYLNTICHGDLSLHNLMFKFERNIPVDCAFVDFQSYRYAPPAHDLMSFLYLSTDREFRKAQMDKVIELYYDELLETLKVHGGELAQLVGNFPTFCESCNYYKLFAIAQAAIHFHHTMLTEDQLKAFYEVPGLNDKMFFEDRSEFVINMCNADPVYKEKLRETINDLQEFCGATSSMKKAIERKTSSSKLSFAPNVPFLAGRRYSRDAL